MNITIKTTTLVYKREKVLLIKEWSKKKNGYFWNVIKGTFNPEKDRALEQAVVREAKEEIGLDIKVKNILSIFEINKDSGFLLQANFISTPANKSTPSLPKIFEQDEEIIEFSWFSYKEFKKIDRKDLMDKRVEIIVNDYFSKKIKHPLSIIKGVD